MEAFIKTIYNAFASFVANVLLFLHVVIPLLTMKQEFEGAIKNFPLCNIGDFENEWVTTVLSKLEWVYTLLKAYKFQDTFMQVFSFS